MVSIQSDMETFFFKKKKKKKKKKKLISFLKQTNSATWQCHFVTHRECRINSHKKIGRFPPKVPYE
jgi:hypothetical protein